MPSATTILLGGALFSPEGKLLLVQRRSDSNAASAEWELPGGRLEFGESPEPGLVRCFLDAVALDVSIDRPLGAWSVLRNEEGRGPHQFVHIDFMVRTAAALLTVEIDTERFSKFAWLPQQSALDLPQSPGARESIERAFGTLAKSRRNSV